MGLHTLRHLTPALTLAVLIASPALADEGEFQFLLRLEGQSFIPESGDLGAGLAYLALNGERATAHVLVQFNEIPSDEDRAQMIGAGVTLQGYLPERAYYAQVSTELGDEDFAAMGVRWMAPLDEMTKLSARVRSGSYPDWTQYPQGRRIYAVQFHRDVIRESAQALLSRVGAELGDWVVSLNTQIAAFEPADISALVSADEIRYIDMIPPPLSEVNNSVRSAMGVDAVLLPPYGLTGAGSNVLVYDAGLIDRAHPDFDTRVIWGETGGIASHGTHVGGTVGGSGLNSGGNFAGMAKATKLTSFMYEACEPFCLYNSPQDIAENYETGFRVHGAMYSTNSLGANIATNGYDCAWEGDYELTAQLLDAIAVGETFEAPFLSIWAAGNERQSPRCGTTYYTTGVPATAKNPIVVGAINSNDHSMTWFSSWGPVDDGRIRPDVVAPGCQTNDDNGVTSTRPGSGYGVSCGTSMATPAVAGTVALLRQQGQAIWALVPPRPSMIKALVVNTAHDLGNPGPDYQFGFGEVHAPALMDHLRNDYLRGAAAISQDHEATYEVEVEALYVLRATLAWDDVPGELLAEKELVNDLDLRLESPSGNFHDPWLLDPVNPATNAGRGADHINNVEQVWVDAPENGVWKIHVRGFLIPEGPQSYSVVANAERASSSEAPEVAESAPRVDLSTYPNPFSPRTTIRFTTDGSAPVDVEVFDSSGRRVRTLLSGDARAAGTHFVSWDGRDDAGDRLAGGVYFYQVRVGSQELARKVLMLN